MIEVRNVRNRLKEIRELDSDKDEKVRAKAGPALQQLHNVVFDDLSKTSDQRTRHIMKLLFEFKLKE